MACNARIQTSVCEEDKLGEEDVKICQKHSDVNYKCHLGVNLWSTSRWPLCQFEYK